MDMRLKKICIACVSGLVFFTFAPAAQKALPVSREPLLCYVGGTMRPAMEELAKNFESATGNKVSFDFAESGQLLIKIEQTRTGDLFVAHDPFPGRLQKEGFAQKTWNVATLTPVIVVKKGNPKKIAGLKDLAKPGLKVILTHPVYSTLGYLLPGMADKAGIRKALDRNTVSQTRSSGEAANAVVMGTADVAIVWNAVAALRLDKLDIVAIEQPYHLQKGIDVVTSATYGTVDMGAVQVSVATLNVSKRPARANEFAEYCASQAAAGTWEKFGFSPALPQNNQQPAQKGEPAPAKGALLVHSGAGLRKAMDKAAQEFEKSTGVKMEMNYDGTGRLLGQIQLAKKGDIFIAGEPEFMDIARKNGLVNGSATVCYFVPVIMVQKGNPLGIKTLSDLLKKGVRVGQGNEKAAAIGTLTPRILSLNNIDNKQWERNVVLSTATVTELASAIKLRTIDAAIVWSTVAKDYAGVSEVISLDASRNVISEVKAAVLLCSSNVPAARAFLSFLTSERGRQLLKENGYITEKP